MGERAGLYTETEAQKEAFAMKQIVADRLATDYKEAERIAELGKSFSVIQQEDYKNETLFALEPAYLKDPDYSGEGLTDLQLRRKVSELALRLGRIAKKESGKLTSDEALKVLRYLMGVNPLLNEAVVFYEDDASRPTRIKTDSAFSDLDFSSIAQNAVECIERKGKNLQQKKEDKIVENGKLPIEDKTRVREITLQRANGASISVVSKRVLLRRMRKGPEDEYEIIKEAQRAGLPVPKPVAFVESRGNYYFLVEKIEGVSYKKLRKDSRGLVQLTGDADYAKHIAAIDAKIEEMKQRFAQSHIDRPDWDPQDVMVDYKQGSGEWKVTPIDFEKSRLKHADEIAHNPEALGHYLAHLIETFFPVEAQSFITRALEKASTAHAGQTRDEDDQYIVHPLRIAISAIEKKEVRDPQLIAVVLLHDVMEDSPTTYEELAAQFGKTVAEKVRLLTKQKNLSKEERAQEYHQRLKKLSKDVRLIKLLDRLDNIRYLHLSPDKEKRDSYIAETEEYYLPLAKSVDSEIHNEMVGIINALKSKTV